MFATIGRSFPVLVGAALWAGCTGFVSGYDGAGGLPGPEVIAEPQVDPEEPSLPVLDAPGEVPVLRLTNLEYRNSLRDLFGVAMAPAVDGFVSDAKDINGSGFSAGAQMTTGSDARQFLDASEALAAKLLPIVPTLLPCNPLPTAVAAQETCAKQFIAQFGLKAFRRPVSAEEAADLFAVFKAQSGADIAATFPQAIASVIEAMIQSPLFLYRGAPGPAATRDGAFVRLDGYEVASRLSYLLWASAPDDALLQAAAANQLSTPEQIEPQARRMLSDAKAKESVADFHFQWLSLSDVRKVPKDASFTNYTPAVGGSMLDESSQFVADLFIGPKATGSLETLLSSSSSYVNDALAKLYELPNVTGAALQLKPLDPNQRSGLLTQGSFLASHATAQESHPIRRGVAIYTRLISCEPLVVPPNLVIPPIAEPQPGQTTRERFAQHTSSSCASCHRLFDDLGFAFEHYDAVGGYRMQDQGKAVNAAGTLRLPSGEVKFEDAIGLTKALSQAKEVRQCVTKQWMRYALRRKEVAGDGASLLAANTAFAKSSYDMRELVVALTKTRAFAYRTPSAGEPSP
jgi:hypothetical protein